MALDTSLNMICKLISELQKALVIFCLFIPAKIPVRFLVFFEGIC